MRKNSFIIIISMMLFKTMACSEDDNLMTPPVDQRNAFLSGIVKHHDAFIPGASVYIKYRAGEFPGTNTSVYDDSIVASGKGFYEIFRLPVGSHFVYSRGYDSAINEVVLGGIPIVISVPGEKRVADIPVTE